MTTQTPIESTTGEHVAPTPLLPREPAASGGPEGPVVLLVDDNTEVRGMLRAMLVEHGVHVVEAVGPTDAKRRLTQRDVDLAVIDLVMPGQHGLHLLSELRTICDRPDLPAVILSALPKGSTRDDARIYCESLGGTEFLDKPVTERRLASVLGRLIAAV